MIKATGIVRRVDDLGRVVIPKEIRKTHRIGENDALEIFVNGDNIILRKYEPACVFCGNADKVINFKGKNVCPNCIKELGN
ncbi:MAG: AbrB/MazE/SpoVT family DNA-binding domain-containing protein [Bacillota bacterium]